MRPTNLIQHPEGGRFKEVFRSANFVTINGTAQRAAITHIYFALREGEVSRFHRVDSDEVWSLYRGDGIRLYTWDGTDTLPTVHTLSADSEQFCAVVRGGTWQAAESIAGDVLAGCSVAPGFEYEDFALMAKGSDQEQRLLSLAPDMKKFTAMPA